MGVKPTAQHIVVLETNIKGQNQDSLVIDPTTGASIY